MEDTIRGAKQPSPTEKVVEQICIIYKMTARMILSLWNWSNDLTSMKSYKVICAGDAILPFLIYAISRLNVQTTSHRELP